MNAVPNWIVIFIICTICYAAMIPIERSINKRIENRYLRYFVNFLLAWVILMCLYFITDLIGIGLHSSD